MLISFLQLLEKAFQQEDDATGGFEKITFLLIRFRLVENEFLKPSFWNSNE